MSELQQAIDKVSQRLNEGPPKMWDFDEDGNQIVGVLVGIEKGHTKKYGPKPILLISINRNGVEETRSVWVLHTALAAQVARKNPYIGDVIGIQRGDMREGAQGEYRDYQVEVYGSQKQPLSFAEVAGTPELGPGPAEAAVGEVVDEGQPVNSWT